MGCGGSKEEAAAVARPPPKAGEGIVVSLVKQGMLDEDFDVKDEGGAKWMLIDTVGGGMFSDRSQYYLKHRLEGQDASTILACALNCEEHSSLDAWVTTPGRERKVQGKSGDTTERINKYIEEKWPESDDEDVKFYNLRRTRSKVKSNVLYARRILLCDGHRGMAHVTMQDGDEDWSVAVEGEDGTKSKTEGYQAIGYVEAELSGQYWKNVVRQQYRKDGQTRHRNVTKTHWKTRTVTYFVVLRGETYSIVESGDEGVVASVGGEERFRISGKGSKFEVKVAPGTADPNADLLAGFVLKQMAESVEKWAQKGAEKIVRRGLAKGHYQSNSVSHEAFDQHVEEFVFPTKASYALNYGGGEGATEAAEVDPAHVEAEMALPAAAIEEAQALNELVKSGTLLGWEAKKRVKLLKEKEGALPAVSGVLTEMKDLMEEGVLDAQDFKTVKRLLLAPPSTPMPEEEDPPAEAEKVAEGDGEDSEEGEEDEDSDEDATPPPAAASVADAVAGLRELKAKKGGMKEGTYARDKGVLIDALVSSVNAA